MHLASFARVIRVILWCYTLKKLWALQHFFCRCGIWSLNVNFSCSFAIFVTHSGKFTRGSYTSAKKSRKSWTCSLCLRGKQWIKNDNECSLNIYRVENHTFFFYLNAYIIIGVFASEGKNFNNRYFLANYCLYI